MPKLLGVLESQKQLGGASYPPTLERLAELMGEKPTKTLKALEEATARALLSREAVSRKKPAPDTTLVLFAEDLEAVAQSDRLLEVLLQSARKPDAPAVELAKLSEGLLPALSSAFTKALEQRIAERRLPRTIGALLGKKPLLFFLADAVLPAAGAPARPPAIAADGAARRAAPDGAGNAISNGPGTSTASGPGAPAISFADRFDAAFSSLDRASGRLNYVTLHALRAALPDIPRDTFDAELGALRRQRRYSLDPSDGRHHQMAEAERDAGIMEAGNLLVYVARRDDA
ncbi:hypothetical protein sce5405 [Sorangium cellulosum So ce56]|uniref:Uncharacterized protein n=1 Tax=Sorangium cellulosum (strain So ce56) TaxID=448385 RepID=A9FY04_SORC5|nr:hypothetical protein [Sorangium cellulosum]CAN95568.1 hypothetical protein sce5405 [Sorangium cellulosum So ce56]